MNDTLSDDLPLCSRAANPNRTFVEVRPLVPTSVVSVIDAHCIARSKATGHNVSREAMVKEILAEWAQREHLKATVIVAVCGSNPEGLDSTGDHS